MSVESALKVIRSFLAQGWNGNWLWETAIEDAAEELGLRHSADYCAISNTGRTCRNIWPRVALAAPIWATLNCSAVAGQAIDLICYEFAKSQDCDLLSFGQSALSAMNSRIRVLPGPRHRLWAWGAIDQAFREHSDSEVNRSPGIYLLWRIPNHGALIYVGESESVADRIGQDGRKWWGNGRPMFVTRLSGTEMSCKATRREAKSVLSAVLEPPGF